MKSGSRNAAPPQGVVLNLQPSVDTVAEVLSRAAAGLAETDRDGQFTFVNDRFCTIVGRTRGELLKLREQDITHPDDISKTQVLLDRLVDAEEEAFVFEKRYLRPDGSVVWVRNSVSAITGHSGQVRRALSVPIDFAERKRLEHNSWLADLVDNSLDAIVSKDLNGIVSSWNKGAERLFGFSADEIIGRSITTIIPTDRLNEEVDILDRIRNGKKVDHFETIRRRKDGSSVDISLTISPIRDEEGRIVGASKIARDITERKLVELQREVLAKEVQHRTKNLFSVVLAVVSKSLDDSKTVAEIRTTVMNRLHAMAQTHQLLLEKEGATADLRELVSVEMAPFGARVTIAGPDVSLAPRVAQNFSLVLHELGTNAVKHGALSRASGRVNIIWSVDSDVFDFVWREAGGPVVTVPSREGFGSTVLKNVMIPYFNQPPEISYAPTGLVYRLSGSLAGLKAD